MTEQYHLAARTGCILCLQILIRAGMDPYQPTEQGEMALDIARRQFKRPIVNLLMDKDRVEELKVGGLAALLPSADDGEGDASESEIEDSEDEEMKNSEPPRPGTNGVPLTVLQKPGSPKMEVLQYDNIHAHGDTPTDEDPAFKSSFKQRFESMNRSQQSLRDEKRVLLKTLENNKRTIKELQDQNEYQQRQYNAARKIQTLSPIEQTLADAIACYDLDKLSQAIVDAGEVRLRPDNEMLLRAQQAQARLYMRGASLRPDMDALAKAQELVRIAKRLNELPYLPHVVIEYCRYLEQTEWSHGASDAIKEVKLAQEIVYEKYREMVGILRQEDSKPTDYILTLMESFEKIVPFPAEAHVIPVYEPNPFTNSVKHIILYFEYDGHCFVHSSARWQQWMRYIILTATALSKERVLEQCREAYTVISSSPFFLQGEFESLTRETSNMSPQRLLEMDMDMFASLAEDLRHSHFYRAFKLNTENVRDERGPWHGNEGWWKVYRLSGPEQVPEPAHVENTRETVVWRYYPSHCYVTYDYMNVMNDRVGCCPEIGNEEGCCGCVCIDQCTMEIQHQGCCDLSPTSCAVGFCSAGCGLFALGVIFFIGWAGHFGAPGFSKSLDSLCDYGFITCESAASQGIMAAILFIGFAFIGLSLFACGQICGYLPLFDMQVSIEVYQSLIFCAMLSAHKSSCSSLCSFFTQRYRKMKYSIHNKPQEDYLLEEDEEKEGPEMSFSEKITAKQNLTNHIEIAIRSHNLQEQERKQRDDSAGDTMV